MRVSPGVAVHLERRMRDLDVGASDADRDQRIICRQAQRHPEKPTYKFEKCYGIAKAGTNDCFTAKNACGATSEADRQGDAWIYLQAGVCERIVGGSLDPKK